MINSYRSRPGEVDLAAVPPVDAELLATPYFNVRVRASYYTVEIHQHAVNVLPVVRGRGVVMVRVHRPVLGDTPLETPGGGVMANEAPAQAAQRELAEETGIHLPVERFVAISPVCSDPSRSVRLVHLFRVEMSEEEFAARALHDHEIAEVQMMPFAQLRQAWQDGAIYVMGTMATLLRGLTFEELAAP